MADDTARLAAALRGDTLPMDLSAWTRPAVPQQNALARALAGVKSTFDAQGAMGFVPPELRDKVQAAPQAAHWLMQNVVPGSSDVSSLMDYSKDAAQAGRSALAGDWSGAGSKGISALANLLAAAPMVPGVAGVMGKEAPKVADDLGAAVAKVADHEGVLLQTMKALGLTPTRVSQSGKSEAKYFTFAPEGGGAAFDAASKKGKSLFVQEFPGGHPFTPWEPFTVRVAGHSNHGAGTSTPGIQWSINRTPEENAEFVRQYVERARELAKLYPAGGQK